MLGASLRKGRVKVVGQGWCVPHPCISWFEEDSLLTLNVLKGCEVLQIKLLSALALSWGSEATQGGMSSQVLTGQRKVVSMFVEVSLDIYKVCCRLQMFVVYPIAMCSLPKRRDFFSP